MSNWIERGQKVTENTADEAVRTQQREAQESQAQYDKVNKVMRDRYAYVDKRIHVTQSVDDIFRKHWKLGERDFSEDGSSFVLRFRYPALLSVYEVHYTGDGYTQSSSSEDTGSRVVAEVETRLGVVITTDYQWMAKDEYEKEFLSIENKVPYKLVQESSDEYEPIPHNSREWKVVRYKNPFGFFSSKAFEDELSRNCYTRENENLWPEDLQAVEDAAIIKALNDGISVQGLSLHMGAEILAREVQRGKPRLGLLTIWQSISGGKR